VSSLPGCALLSTGFEDDSRYTLREHVEDIFRRQNNATSEVMMLSMEEFESEEFIDLTVAEEEMENACAALNEYAVRARDQLSTGFWLKNRVLNSIDECEGATQIVESLLKDFKAD